jgi:large subunit ribosomal protein L9
MAKKILAENLKQQAHKLAAQKAAAEERGKALEGVALTITAKVSTTGQLYGSVNTATVAEELKKLGHDVDRKIITMRDIKKVGEYVALVHFHKEVTAEIPVTVLAEGQPEVAEEKAPVSEQPAAEEEVVAEEQPAEEEAPAAE